MRVGARGQWASTLAVFVVASMGSYYLGMETSPTRKFAGSLHEIQRNGNDTPCLRSVTHTSYSVKRKEPTSNTTHCWIELEWLGFPITIIARRKNDGHDYKRCTTAIVVPFMGIQAGIDGPQYGRDSLELLVRGGFGSQTIALVDTMEVCEGLPLAFCWEVQRRDFPGLWTMDRPYNTKIRPWAAHSFLLLGVSVLLLDADSWLLNDPFPYFDSTLEVQAPLEGYSRYHDGCRYFNMGFVYYRATYGTLYMLQTAILEAQMLHEKEDSVRIADQTMVNRIIVQMEDAGWLTTGGLDSYRFALGCRWLPSDNRRQIGGGVLDGPKSWNIFGKTSCENRMKSIVMFQSNCGGHGGEWRKEIQRGAIKQLGEGLNCEWVEADKLQQGPLPGGYHQIDMTVDGFSQRYFQVNDSYGVDEKEMFQMRNGMMRGGLVAAHKVKWTQFSRPCRKCANCDDDFWCKWDIHAQGGYQDTFAWSEGIDPPVGYFPTCLWEQVDSGDKKCTPTGFIGHME
eukprot:TRINITY_DN60697_c0_g1_i1.p1 TRINITY_DN60697_c0_g1~~TRINITY_DN60697_c0_g1_i1.p1  ORF type:complete len:517 (+),score=27.94 TRINITY_DN60697_c0_g1_i1:26-1552(+)